MKVLCIGNSSYDITIPVEIFPIENKKIKLEHKVIECGGGSGSNAACLLASWGVDTTIASVIGNDLYGEKIKKEYLDYHVNTKYLKQINDNTSVSYIIDNLENNSRTILVNKNNNLVLDKDLIIDSQYDYILLDGSNIEFAKQVLSNQNCVSIIDAGRLSDNIVELSHLVDYVVCSNDFAKDYTGINFSYNNIDDIKKAYDILDNDFKGKIVITLENFGSFVKINDDYKLIPSIKIDSLDTTGAGDLYHGAFVYFLMNNYSLEKIMRLSNITGALSTRFIGGRNSIPKLDEVLEYDK